MCSTTMLSLETQCYRTRITSHVTREEERVQHLHCVEAKPSLHIQYDPFRSTPKRRTNQISHNHHLLAPNLVLHNHWTRSEHHRAWRMPPRETKKRYNSSLTFIHEFSKLNWTSANRKLEQTTKQIETFDLLASACWNNTIILVTERESTTPDAKMKQRQTT